VLVATVRRRAEKKGELDKGIPSCLRQRVAAVMCSSIDLANSRVDRYDSTNEITHFIIPFFYIFFSQLQPQFQKQFSLPSSSFIVHTPADSDDESRGLLLLSVH
jgi:hypothetical protein